MPEKEKLPEPSEEFKLSVRHAASISVTCELCNRYHFGNDQNALEESLGKKEYAKLLRDSKENPDKYVYHNEDMISWGNIDGKQAVIDCSCNELSKYESFIWIEKHIIADYLEARAKKEVRSAKLNKDLADRVKKSVK